MSSLLSCLYDLHTCEERHSLKITISRLLSAGLSRFMWITSKFSLFLRLQHDAFCVAGTIHAVLLGKYIAVRQTQSLASSSGTGTSAAPQKALYRPSTSVPSSNSRKPLWDRLFRTLLNCPLAPERPDVTPLLAEFTSVRTSSFCLPTTPSVPSMAVQRDCNVCGDVIRP